MMARDDLIKMTGIKAGRKLRASHVDICGESIPGRGSKFKGL